LKQLLSDFISLFFPVEEGETHSWPTILGVLLFFAFLFFMFGAAKGCW